MLYPVLPRAKTDLTIQSSNWNIDKKLKDSLPLMFQQEKNVFWCWKTSNNALQNFQKVNHEAPLVFTSCYGISIVVFEHVNISWIYCHFNWEQYPIDWFLYGMYYSQIIVLQSQQRKHLGNVWNLLKIDNKDTIVLYLLLIMNRFYIFCFRCWLVLNDNISTFSLI